MSEIRILRDTGPTTITKRFYRDGTQSGVGVVTIGIVDEDGTVIVTAGTATTLNGSDATTTYTFDLAAQAEVNRAVVTWTATDPTPDEIVVDTLVIVGGWIFTEAELRAHYDSDLSDTDADFTDALLAEARDRITIEFEQICNVAFVPTYNRETIPGNGGRILELDKPYISQIIAATIGTTTQTVANLTPDPRLPWVYHTTSFWNHATATDPLNVTISYVYGHPDVPPDIKRAAMILARMQLLKDVKGQGVPEIASSFTDPTGQYTSFGANDMTGRWYGIPVVDATLRRYSLNIPLVSL